MKLSHKLLLNILIVLGLAAAAMAVAWTHFNMIHKFNKEVQEQTLRFQLIADIRYHFTKQEAYLKEYILNKNKIAINSYKSELKTTKKIIEKLNNITRDEINKEQIEKIVDLYNSYNYFVEQEVISFLNSEPNSTEQALSVYNLNAKPTAVNLIRIIEQYKDRKMVTVNKMEEQSLYHLQKAKTVLLLLGTLALVLGLAVNHIIVRKIVITITSLSEEAKKMAAGDLTVRVKAAGKDELATLAQSFNTMADSLRHMATSLMQSSQKLASNSQQLSAASQEVSSAVDGISSSTAQVASVAQQSAAGAGRAAELIQSVQQAVKLGNRSVQDTAAKIGVVHQVAGEAVNRIQGLNEKSKQIGYITKLISEITEQTNMLALNAAIEAARAGEHGRGFAVVAEEVRQLAEKSAQAAAQISELVENIQHETANAAASVQSSASEVNEGMEIAQRAGNLLDDINERIGWVTEIIAEVASGAHESSSGTKDLASSTEKVTATVQQIASSAHSLAEMAEQLQSQVNKFKIN